MSALESDAVLKFLSSFVISPRASSVYNIHLTQSHSKICSFYVVSIPTGMVQSKRVDLGHRPVLPDAAKALVLQVSQGVYQESS